MKSNGETERYLPTFQTAKTFLKLGTCSEALANVLNRACGNICKFEERAAVPLAGGILKRGFQCGMLWGATLAAGAEIYRNIGSGPEAESAAVDTAGKLVEAFRAANCAINCRELTGVKWQSPAQIFIYFVKGGPLKCMLMSGRFANNALSVIQSATRQEPSKAAQLPCSCASETARLLGASEMQCAMAAGFAGGIGLSGAACGALGATLWMLAIEFERRGVKDVWKSEEFSAESEALISRFLEAGGGKFECSEITAKKFANVADHADYLQKGGCAKIINALAKKQG